ncbi:MAG TPA: radical SAM protein [Acidimicrobiales bacterium]
MRWKLVEEEDGAGQGALFSEEEIVDRHVGTGEYRGLEFLHVRAKRIVNEVPAAAHLPFRWTINAYRGCSHSCVYCLAPDTPVLMADGTHRPISELAPGDEIVGTARTGADASERRFVRTGVVATWRTVRPAWRVRLADGTALVASGDHRFLSTRGWKFVTGDGCGAGDRPHLVPGDSLVASGPFPEQPKHDDDYRRGYLCAVVRAVCTDRRVWVRRSAYLAAAGVADPPHPSRGARMAGLIGWPDEPTESWRKGFLAGAFDAEGTYADGELRLATGEDTAACVIAESLASFGFDLAVSADDGGPYPVTIARVRGGQREHQRFFHLVDPVITPHRTLAGEALDDGVRAGQRVVAIELLGVDIPMCDITTGTGDFVANGVVSHNCFARPTHDYLGLNIGSDFDSKIVVKVNAVERLRAELSAKRWSGDPIAMGTNTDPYQRCEGKYHLTQGIIRVLGERANPFSILTKSTLILRDLPLLAEAAARTDVRVNFSIGTLDPEVWKATEPGTPHPLRRVEAVRKFNDAGIPCGVLVAPLIPGMSDSREHIDAVVAACVDAGAVSIMGIPLHLRKGVKDHFMAWLRGARPDLVAEYERRYRGSHLPKAEQEAIGALVRRARAEAGGDGIPAGNPTSHIDVRAKRADAAGQAGPVAEAEPEAAQQTLL